MKYKIGVLVEVDIPFSLNEEDEDDFLTKIGTQMFYALNNSNIEVNGNWLLSCISEDEPDYDTCIDFLSCEPLEWQQ